MTWFAVSPTIALLGGAIIGLAASLSLMRSRDSVVGIGQRVRAARVKTGGDVVWRMAVVATHLLIGDTVVEPRIRWQGHRGHRPRLDQRSHRLRSCLTVRAVVGGHGDVHGQRRPQRPVDGHAPRVRLGLDDPARGRLHPDEQRCSRPAGPRLVAERCHRYQHLRRSAQPRPRRCGSRCRWHVSEGVRRPSGCHVLRMPVGEVGLAEHLAEITVHADASFLAQQSSSPATTSPSRKPP